MPKVKTKDGKQLFQEEGGKLFSILMSLKMAGKRTDDLVVGEDEVPAEEWIAEGKKNKFVRKN